MASLSEIPFYGAYRQASNENRAAGAQELQQVGALQGILAKVQAAQQEQAYRGALANAKTPEEQASVAMKFGKPSEILGHLDRQTAASNTRELGLQRITQGARDAMARLAVAERNATTAEQRAEVARGRAEVQNWYQRGSLALQGGKAAYELPPEFVPNIGPAPTGVPAAAPSAQPQPNAARPSFPPSGPVGPRRSGDPLPIRFSAAEDADNAADLRSPESRASLERELGRKDLSPQARAILQAEFARNFGPDAQPLPEAGAAPNNLDARDLRLASMGTATAPAAAAPAAAPAQQMPQFTGSPRERAAAQNKWLASQTKGGEAGGKASETLVDAIVQGRMQVPTGFALRSPYWQDIMERVAKKDPKFDASNYGARAAARRTFASGPEARNVTALNTVIGHLGTLDEAAQALNNSDIRAFNAVANRLATELGDPRIQNFDTARQAVAEETMRVFRQVGASETEARMWGERIQSSGSPGQLRGVIGTLGKLLESRVDAIGQQYERTVNQQGNPARVDQANKARLDQLIQQGGGGPKAGAVENGYRFKGGNPADKNNWEKVQ